MENLLRFAVELLTSISLHSPSLGVAIEVCATARRERPLANNSHSLDEFRKMT